MWGHLEQHIYAVEDRGKTCTATSLVTDGGGFEHLL
jgi:hypothetical protein